MPNRGRINQRGIDNLHRDLQKAFDRRGPLRIPVKADADGVLPAAATVNNYHGPVVTVQGDNAQIAWDNDRVRQSQKNTATQQIAPGYEELARLVTDLLASLDKLPLSESDAGEVRASADTVLQEVVKAQPDHSIVRRTLTVLKGLLAPIAVGAEQGVEEGTQDLARHVIESLGQSLPF